MQINWPVTSSEFLQKTPTFCNPTLALNGLEISYLHIITRHFFGEFVILNIWTLFLSNLQVTLLVCVLCKKFCEKNNQFHDTFLISPTHMDKFQVWPYNRICKPGFKFANVVLKIEIHLIKKTDHYCYLNFIPICPQCFFLFCAIFQQHWPNTCFTVLPAFCIFLLKFEFYYRTGQPNWEFWLWIFNSVEM